jgi:hypothetical protein
MCDKNGIVEGSVPGLARLAVVSREQCKEALDVLMSPDPDSRTSEHEGRRVVEVDGGWQLLNYQKYRDKVGATSQSNRERVARHRDRHRSKESEQSTAPEQEQLFCADDVTHVMPVTANVTDVTLQTVTSITCNDVTPGNGCNGKCNDLNIAVVRSKSDLSSGSDAREAEPADSKVSCPKELRLTDDQFESLRMDSGIPAWAIEQSTAAFIANYIADPNDTRQLVHWRKCLAKAIIGDWRDPNRRPKKPEEEAKPKSIDASTLGVTL